ncbi:MAG: DNA cytosine methyltransferase [Thermoleophilia bacterium]
MTDPSLVAVSLYSGCGGLDLGFVRAGFRVAWAVDSDKWAVESYRVNLGNHVVHAELPDGVTLPSDMEPDVVIGGPPCQGFSVIGRMDPSDPRSRHVFSFVDAVEALRPRAFVMENVKALATAPRWSDVRSELMRRARGLGYQTELFLLNAADFGVPQRRERMFLVGVAGMQPLCPIPTTLGVPVTVGEALRSLPTFGSPGNDMGTAAKVVPAQAPVMRPTAHKGSLLFNGSGRPLDLDQPAKTLPASMGGNATPIVDQHELAGGAEPWVVGYHARLAAGEAPLAEAPSRMRRLTVQEAAALQSFPNDWKHRGPQAARYRQIGNAVPPLLAEAVARSVAAALRSSVLRAVQPPAIVPVAR